MSLVSIKTALLSVSDKTGLIEFAQTLVSYGVKLLSTGGTALALKNANLPVQDISDYIQFPEMMDGRVKTLHPKVHGGLLALRDNPEHIAAQKQHGIDDIDLVVVNLYPFEEIIAKNPSYQEAIENIDIGGPAMLRSAAKNHASVTVITDVADYAIVTAELAQHQGKTSYALRQKLAAKTYARTSLYDGIISRWFAEQLDAPLSDYISFSGVKQQDMRYGENPHQQACLYKTNEQRFGVVNAKQIQGKELSYNNINDTDAAFELVAELDAVRPACVIVKHANPCGVAYGETLKDAYLLALRCDPVSAFGGIIAFNQLLDADTALEITKIFTEVIIAPDATPEAQAIIAQKANLRLLLTGGLPDKSQTSLLVKSVAGGLLVQTKDIKIVSPAEMQVVTKRHPSPQEWQDMLFAFQVAKHVKSNAIIYAKQQSTVGIGAGQMSRLDSSKVAASKALEAAEKSGLAESLAVGAVVASDAFFPFADGLIAAASAGITAIIQPGGSVRDSEVIAAADERDLAMVFTGTRHFKH